MKNKLLLQERDYTIVQQDAIPEEAFDFLDSVAWGYDGTVYEHRNTAERFRSLHHPTLIAIYKNEVLAATVVFCNAQVNVGRNIYNSYYARYFAASKEIKGRGVVPRYSVKVMQGIRENENRKTVYFSCVEKSNRSSQRINEKSGYYPIGVMKTNGFSRFFPKKGKSLEQVKSETVRSEVLNLLKKQYEQHALVQFNSIFQKDNYYVIRRNGEIVAGCQYFRVHWVVNKMPGLSGKIILNIVPRIPLLNQMFNPKRFEFLAFEGIYVKPGYENRLMELFEGLLEKEKLKSAMYWMAEKCPVRKRIAAQFRPGLLHSFVRDSDANITASFHHMNDDEVADLKERPLFASAFDYI